MGNVTHINKLHQLYREYPANSRLVLQGNKPKTFFILVSGRLKVLRNDTLIDIIKDRGDYVGEIAILLDTRHNATVISETPATLIPIDVAKVESFLFSTPNVAISLARRLSQRLVRVNRELAMIMKMNHFNIPIEEKFSELHSNTKGNINLENLKKYFIEYPKDTEILKQDNYPKALYILVNGEIEITKNNKTIARESKQGHYLGDVSILRDAASNATVTTKTKSTLIEIPVDKVESFLNHSPEIAISISKGLATRILSINDYLMDVKATEINNYKEARVAVDQKPKGIVEKEILVDLLGFDPDG
ncbi:MAG: cyclic nucleotide-binding domain-containing protein [Spirochaetota bacterium]